MHVLPGADLGSHLAGAPQAHRGRSGNSTLGAVGALSGVGVISVPPVDGGLACLTEIRRRRHRSADKVCETQRMAPTDDEKWLVVDGRRWRPTDPAIPADALARLKSHLGRGGNGVRTARNAAKLDDSGFQDQGR